MKAIRGAVNFTENTVFEISKKTEELFVELQKANELDYSKAVCILFSLTKDVTAAYPAATFREKFSSAVPLFSCTEPDVDGSLPLTLRVLILHEGDSCKPIYLYDTKNLRKDLFYEHRD